MSLNVKFTNNTSISSSDIYWICFGLDGPDATANWSYVSVNNGNAALENFTAGQDCAPLFNSIAALNSFEALPEMWSGQFLFCFNGLPKTFNIVTTGVPNQNHGIGVQTPSFLPGTADANTIFAVVEFTYSGDIWCDSTIVDYFCVPIELEVIGDTTKSNGIMKSSSNRDSIFTQIENLGAPWSSLIMRDDNSNYVRVIGPQHGVQQNIIPADYYSQYVDHVWEKYADTGSEKLTVNCPTFGQYTGTTDTTANTFTFKQTGQPDVVINKPTNAYDIFGCVGTLNAPNNTPLGEIAAIVGAAFNRTVLYEQDIQAYCTTNDFYKLTSGEWAVTNEFAKAVHDNYQSGIYAFPFDDVCSSDSPLIQVSNPTQFNITLASWD